jgi:hypothetical protein
MSRVAPTSRSIRLGRLVLLGVLVAACHGGASGSPETRSASARAEELFGALAVRFGTVRRDSALEASRAKLIRYTLSPSRIYGDSAIWTSRGEGERALVIAGRFTDDEYLVAAAPGALAPHRTGDMRATFALRRITPSVYQWDTHTEMSAGPLRIEDFALVFAQGERAGARSEEELRLAYRAALARSSETLGRLFEIDSIRATPCPDGGSTLRVVLSFHPDHLDGDYPGFSAYLKRYIEPGRYRLALVDGEGVQWLRSSAGDGRLSFELRLHEGKLAPLDAPLRPVPDSMELRGSISLRGPLFTFGATELVAGVEPIRGAGQRGIAIRFRDEPRWHFPLAVRHLIGGSLRRPFEGEGTELHILATERAGEPLLLGTSMHTVVQESFIVRWLGRYGSSLLGALTPDVEREADRFLSELFASLEADLRQMREVAEARPTSQFFGVTDHWPH